MKNKNMKKCVFLVGAMMVSSVGFAGTSSGFVDMFIANSQPQNLASTGQFCPNARSVGCSGGNNLLSLAPLPDATFSTLDNFNLTCTFTSTQGVIPGDISYSYISNNLSNVVISPSTSDGAHIPSSGKSSVVASITGSIAGSPFFIADSVQFYYPGTTTGAPINVTCVNAQ